LHFPEFDRGFFRIKDLWTIFIGIPPMLVKVGAEFKVGRIESEIPGRKLLASKSSTRPQSPVFASLNKEATESAPRNVNKVSV
jgi:hypothetical protein